MPPTSPHRPHFPPPSSSHCPTLEVVDLHLQAVGSKSCRHLAACLLAALKADRATLVLANVADLDSEFRGATGRVLQPGDHLVEFMSVVVVKDDSPALTAGPAGTRFTQFRGELTHFFRPRFP